MKKLIKISSLLTICGFLFINCGKTKDDTMKEEILVYDVSKEIIIRNESYGKDPSQKFDIYLPAKRTANTPVLFIIHGGGWVSGSKNGFDNMMPNLRNIFPSYAFVLINYRLFNQAKPTQNRFPTQENDVKQCIEYVFSQTKTYTISTRFALWGQSAGAHLAALYAYKYQNKPFKASALIEQVGPTDMLAIYKQIPDGDLKSILNGLIGNPDTKDSLLYKSSSPSEYVQSSSCPTLIMHGTADEIVPYQQAEILRDKLTREGVRHTYKLYEGEGHDLNGVVIEASNEAILFLNENLK